MVSKAHKFRDFRARILGCRKDRRAQAVRADFFLRQERKGYLATESQHAWHPANRCTHQVLSGQPILKNKKGEKK